MALGAGVLGISAVFCEQASAADKEKLDPEAELVDISNLQKWDSNWDGRFVRPCSCTITYLQVLLQGSRRKAENKGSTIHCPHQVPVTLPYLVLIM